MAVKVFSRARRRLVEVWLYTERKWGEEQADRYLETLHAGIAAAEHDRSTWRTLQRAGLEEVYFIRCQHHYLFFRILPSGDLGLLSVLHERMDLPSRLQEDIEGELKGE